MTIDAHYIHKLIHSRARYAGWEFRLSERQNLNPVSAVCEYFAEDPNFEKEWGSLRKSILLFGTVGCGKSSLMKLLQMNPRKDYILINCHQVAAKYSEKGIEGIRPYFSGEKVYCFDDLGIEPEKQYMGNKLNVLEYIMSACYDRHLPFHITTNFTVPQLEEKYGNRMRSRLRETHILIPYPQTAKDLRK